MSRIIDEALILRDAEDSQKILPVVSHRDFDGGAKLPAARSRQCWGLLTQTVLLMLASGAALGPPANGLMLLAPLPGPATASIGWAWQAGAIPVARGPYPGSYVVNGSITSLLIPALSHGALILSARFAPCGTSITKEK